MRMPHNVSAFVLVSFFLSAVQPIHAQQQRADASTSSETARAIETYQQGDATETIKQLQQIVKKHPDDADAWYYLALALNKQGIIANSRPAFDQVVRLPPDSADAHAKLAFA